MFLTKFAAPLANCCCAASNRVEQGRQMWLKNVISAVVMFLFSPAEKNLNKWKGWSKTAGQWTHLTVVNRWTERRSWSPRGHPVGVGRFSCFLEFQLVTGEKERRWCITPSDGNENKRSAWGHCCHTVCVCVWVSVMKPSMYIRCVLAVSQWSLGAQDVYVCVFTVSSDVLTAARISLHRGAGRKKKKTISTSQLTPRLTSPPFFVFLVKWRRHS